MKGFHPASMVQYLHRSMTIRPNEIPLRTKYKYIMGEYIKVTKDTNK